jgi:hypothetical protein
MNTELVASTAPGRVIDDSGHAPRYGDRVPALDVAVVTFPSAQILDVTGPLEVFSSATRLVPARSTARTW